MLDKIIKLFEKIIFRLKLHLMDASWYEMGGRCWGLFPPSFYVTHSDEEIEQITKETLAELKELIDELD